MAVGERIRAIRQSAGLTQEQLGERLGLSDVSAVVAALQGMTVPSLQDAWDELQRPDELEGFRASRIRKYRQDAATARTRLLEGVKLYADKRLDQAGYELLRDDAQAEMAAAEAEVSRLSSGRPTPRTADVREVAAVVAQIGSLEGMTVTRQRELLSDLITQVAPTRIGRARYRVALTWTDLGAVLVALSEVKAAPKVAGLML